MSTVTISGSTIHGVEVPAPGPGETTVDAFFGIPYAKAPVGTRRFHPPAPAELPAEFSADSYGPTASQNQYPQAALALIDNPLVAGEERLNLNVWTPDTTGRAPVYVFIHGGAYRNGSGATTVVNGASFAANGIVTVTINYRLGAEGGLQLPDGTSNNMLRDQIAALQWVRDNIAAFGGDPDHVVVGGESAGAMSVGALLTSPKARGLFHAAILESGATHNVVSQAAALAAGRRFADHLGVEPTAEALGAIPEAAIMKASAEVEAEISGSADADTYADLAANSMTWQPSVDGDVLPARPLDVLAQGGAIDVPVLIGTNQDEGTMFVAGAGTYDTASEEGLVAAAAAAGATDPKKVLELSTDPADPHPGRSMTNYVNMWKFQLPLREFLTRRKGYSSPTFRYKFTWPSQKFGPVLGSHHMLELPFVFNTVDVEATRVTIGEDLPAALAQAAHGAWVSFIKDFDPGWKPYFGSDATTTGVFNADGVHVAEDLDEELFTAWDGLR